MTPTEIFEAFKKMPLESYFISIPILILIVTLIFGEKLFIYLFIVVICFVFYIFKQQIDMELKLLKEKRKNESNMRLMILPKKFLCFMKSSNNKDLRKMIR